MARSNDMSTTMQYVKYYITCTQNSQNITNNTSNVTVTVHIYRTNSGYPTWGSGTMYVNINGTNYSSTITTSHVFDAPPVQVFSTTLNIPHNADGTKVLSMSAYVSHSMFTSSSQSYSQTLTTIARKSTPTLSASSTEMGKTVTINTNRASSSFTHTLKYHFGEDYQTIATGVTTSHIWTVPLALANQIPNAITGTGSIICETYNGSTLIGSNKVTLTATVPNTIVPSFTSLGVSRVDGTVPTAWGLYVKGKSKATLTINGATGSYSSTIKSYAISGGGYSTTSSSFTTGFLNTVGNITFTATITDSRGRTASKTASVTVIDYAQPNISAFTSFRSNSSGTALDSGTYLRCATTFTYSSVSSKNTISANIKYRRVGVTSWTTGASITSGTAITTGGGTISVDYSYEVLLTVTDAFGSVTQTLPISTSSVMLDFKSGGKGVAIGKASETDNLFEVAWNTKINGTLNATNVQVGGTNVLTANGGTLTGGLHIGNGVSSANANTSTYSRLIRATTDDESSFKFQFGKGTNPSFEVVDSAWTKSLFGIDSKGITKINGTEIISQGSGTNGWYVRLYDGTQICVGWSSWNSVSMINDLASSNIYGDTAIGTNGRNVTFSANFTSAPYVIANTNSTGYMNTHVVSSTTSSFQFRIWANYYSVHSAVVTNYIAIGRWK